jgi:hypothetical protein
MEVAARNHSLYIKIETFSDWVTNYFNDQEQQSVKVSGKDADPDGDGLGNYLEYLAKLDPTDSESRLRYHYANDPVETFRIWPISATSNFIIQTSIDMTNWSPLDSNFYQLAGDFLDIDLTTLAPRAFFKVVFSDGIGE